MQKYLTKDEKSNIKRIFKNNFRTFLIEGFVIANCALMTGISYIQGFESKLVMYFFMAQPLVCMIISYYVSFQLFFKGSNIKLKDLFHYIYIGIFTTSFCLGVIYYKIPFNAFIAVFCLYFAVCMIELIFWKIYTKVYLTEFVYKYITALKIERKLKNENNK